MQLFLKSTLSMYTKNTRALTFWEFKVVIEKLRVFDAENFPARQVILKKKKTWKINLPRAQSHSSRAKKKKHPREPGHSEKLKKKKWRKENISRARGHSQKYSV